MPKMRPIAAKKKCCKDKPRCKKCPVVLKRLTELGFAERADRRNYSVMASVPTKAMKIARAR